MGFSKFYHSKRNLNQYLYDPAISFTWIDYVVDSIYIFFHSIVQSISEIYQNQKKKIIEFLDKGPLKELFFENSSLSSLQPHPNQVYRHKKWKKRASSMANDDCGSLSSLEMAAKIEDEIKNSQTNHTQESYSIVAFEIPRDQDLEYYIAQLPDSCFPPYDLDQIFPPKKTKILALDLDETLVHSCFEGVKQWDFMVEVLIGRSSCLYYVFKRPYLDYFLNVVSKWYHLVIFTASLKEYADPVVTWLDNGKRIFKKRLFRNTCQEKDGLYMKDLRLIDNDLSRISLLDNSPASFVLYPDNGILIDTWIDNKADTALLNILPFLDALRYVHDVRTILSLKRIRSSD